MSRPYHQFCGVARALDVVGERWTLLVVRDLLLGPRRFGELSAALAGVPPALLTSRLRDLIAAGLVERMGEGRKQRYGLTERGRDLEPVVLALGRFGAQYLTTPRDGDRLDARWAMVSLKRRYRASARRWRLQFEVGETSFALAMGEQFLDVRDGTDPGADAVVSAPFPLLGALLTGRVSLDDVQAAGLEIEGKHEAVADLLEALEPVPAP